MEQADEVRALVVGHHFGAPCMEADLRRAETLLGEPLPPVLRELYLAFDGFLGSTDAGYFWPLFGAEGLVEMNWLFRSNDVFHQELVSQCLFFGDNGCGPQWGIKRDLPGKVIQWDAEWGTDFEVVGDSPIDVWKSEKLLYDAADEEA